MSVHDVVIESTRENQKRPHLRTITGKKSSGALAFAFLPDSKTFVVSLGELDAKCRGSRLDFYDVESGRLLRSWQDSKLSESADRIVRAGGIQLSRNGRLLLAKWYVYSRSSESPKIMLSLWRVDDGKKLGGAAFNSISIPDAFEVMRTFPTFELQNDGRILGISLDGRVFLAPIDKLDFKSKPIFAVPSLNIKAATLSPDGTYLVAGTESGQVVRQWLN